MRQINIADEIGGAPSGAQPSQRMLGQRTNRACMLSGRSSAALPCAGMVTKTALLTGWSSRTHNGLTMRLIGSGAQRDAEAPER